MFWLVGPFAFISSTRVTTHMHVHEHADDGVHTPANGFTLFQWSTGGCVMCQEKSQCTSNMQGRRRQQAGKQCRFQKKIININVSWERKCSKHNVFWREAFIWKLHWVPLKCCSLCWRCFREVLIQLYSWIFRRGNENNSIFTDNLAKTQTIVT